MKNKKKFLVVLLLSVLFAGSCSVEKNIDQKKFEGISRAAQAVKAGLAGGATYQQFGGLLQNLSGEIEDVRNKVTSQKETELLKAYSVLLSCYHDGHVLWKYKLEFAHFDFVPEGRIYVGQDVEPIVFKYNFPTESHMYKPTGQYWKSIAEDSIQIIWSNADSQFKIIEGILLN